MIALAFALALFVPGPNDPVCDPAAGIVTECAQGQLPGEVIGREIDAPPEPAPATTVDPAAIVLEATTPAAVVPTPARRLAHTGVPTAPYLAAAAALIGAGVLLRRVTSQTRVQVAPAPQSAD